MIDFSSPKARHFLSILSYIEGTSLLVLFFIAMPIKYILGNPAVVSSVGMIHGLLFIALVVFIFIVASEAKWPKSLLWFALISAVVPFGMFALDKKLKKNFATEGA